MCKHQEYFNFRPGAKLSGASLSLFLRSIPRNHLNERTSGCCLPNQLQQSEGESEENPWEKKETDLKQFCLSLSTLPCKLWSAGWSMCRTLWTPHLWQQTCLPVYPLGSTHLWGGWERLRCWTSRDDKPGTRDIRAHFTYSWCCKWGLGFGELYLLFQVHNAVLILINHAAQFRHCFSKFYYSFPNWGSVLSGSFNVIVSSSLKFYFKSMREAVGLQPLKRKKEIRWPAKSYLIKIYHNSRWLSFHLLILFSQWASMEAMNVLFQYF